jgi:rSAM/selenodomain-associated transferase 1
MRPSAIEFQVVVMAKAPVPGEVKTRLCPPLSHEQAAALAQAALLDTMAAVSASSARRRVLALQGSPGIWMRPGFDVIPQRSGHLGSRLAGAIDDAWATFPAPILVVGMDTPQLGGTDLDRAARVLIDTPDSAGPSAVIGPAEDGGYWAIGTRRPVFGMFDGVPMSTDGTRSAQQSRLRALGVSCTSTRWLRDVDHVEDAVAVAALAPGTRFAATLQPMMALIHAWAGDSLAPTAAGER